MAPALLAGLLTKSPAARELGRVLAAAGFALRGSADAAALVSAGCTTVCASFDELSTLRRARVPGPYLVWQDQADPEALALCASAPEVGALVGLRYPGAMPRAWELLSLAQRVASRTPMAPSAWLCWGGQWHVRRPRHADDRDAIVDELEAWGRALVGDRQAQELSQLGHELLMNAMFDAPVDGEGRARYAHDRKARIQLEPHEVPIFGYGSDGVRLVVSAVDPFGRLPRESVFGGLYRALKQGTMDQRGGGAGLGMLLIYQSASILSFDVVPGVQTVASAVVELDVPTRELRTLPRSVHFLSASQALGAAQLGS